MASKDVDFDFPDGSVVKNLAAYAGDLGSVPGSERFPGEGNGNPLQYFYLENPIDREAWWAVVYGVAKSWTQLSNWATTTKTLKGFPLKDPPARAGDMKDAGWIPGLGWSPAGEHCNPLQCSYLENPMDRGAWQATVDGITDSWTQLRQLNIHAGKDFEIWVLYSNFVHLLGKSLLWISSVKWTS